MRERPPTSLDVAKLAGVSQATVSYVLNDRPNSRVGPATRAKVQAAANELGYVAHASARSLRTGDSGLVLFPMADIPIGPLASRFLDDLDHNLTERGFTMVTYGARQGRGLAAARAWAELRPAAIVVETSRLTRQSVDLLRSAGVRAILGLSPKPSNLVDTLLTDQHAIGAMAAAHLIAQGRRRLAVVVPKEDGLRTIGLDRREGFLQIAKEATTVDVAFGEEFDLPDCDGVFAYNDEYAMLLMAKLQDRAVRIPDEVAIVGVDDLPLARLLRPRLTTIGLDLSGAPALVADLITRLIEGQLDNEPVRLWTPRLVVREST